MNNAQATQTTQTTFTNQALPPSTWLTNTFGGMSNSGMAPAQSGGKLRKRGSKKARKTNRRKRASRRH